MADTPKLIRLLMVDDEPEFLSATARVLGRRGFTVSTAEDGPAALELLGQEVFDAVVLDVKMPGMDGVEVFRRIRSTWPATPVLILTGHGTIGEAFQTSREGLCEYLSKPCDPDRLAKAVRDAAAALRTDAAEEPEDEVEISVLLVDDEPDICKSLSSALSRRGMRVTAVGSSGEAVAELESQEFDVVVTDQRLPGMDGLLLLQRIRHLHPATEVILLTGYPSMGGAVEAIRLGAFDYLAKPQEVSVLANRIRDAFHRRRSRLSRERESATQELMVDHPVD